VHIYNGRSAAPTQLNKQGKMAWAFPKAWVKSPSFTAGQCPVMHYNRVLMMAILWDRMPYLTPLLNTEIISLEKAPEAYKIFQRVTQEIRDRPAQHAKDGGLSPHGLQ